MRRPGPVSAGVSTMRSGSCGKRSCEAPRHPRVLNEVALERLIAGDPSGAYQVLTEAIKDEPSNPSLWLNLAAALRGLDRHDEEMGALQRVLAIEPRNLRALLQKASLLELQNKPRAAAAAYRTALQTLTPGTRTPEWMAQVLAHAREAVDANNRTLEAFLEERLTSVRARHADQSLRRFDRCLATLVQKERIYRQQPSFMYFPYLPAIEFYQRSDFPWLESIEAAAGDICEELVNVLSDGDEVLEPYVSHARAGSDESKWRDLHQSRRWAVYFLWREGSRTRSTFNVARGPSPHSRAGPAANCRAAARRQSFPCSMAGPAFLRTPASTTRASSSICR